MEIISDVEEKEAVPEEHFVPERAIFSQLQDREEKENNFEYFANVANPVFEHVEKPPTRHGEELRHFMPVEAKAGEGDK